ncbi:CsgG/HfaB family protein [Ulvibacter antarcticus]|uniref:Curli production assembly/transport component CsgG n=1 Tax=Ulvibacter antarcticus TaxID=442714 RepID=A0A3L9YAW4_9FLAO|nr:CsgG/HfaB family protein [Ulvibacter antarcticus]RMA57876.1 curli production assembly/transport component CsgG [Ulvibacter antarcticus]
MRSYYKIVSLLVTVFLASSCGTYFNQPVTQQDARTGELTPKSAILKEFPLPMEPVVVGVYNFKDQTGQYKSAETGSTFSTAVSQGATTILVKALEDSKWFTPIERENLGNLLSERNIIRSTRDEYRKNSNPNEPNLPPLLYAGILLEGGVVSYDSNILTGGLGARYFGVGGSTQYREDRITVYLRAVSTSNGRILKTVYISKTILSQAVDVSLFKYVNFQRLLEAETGYTKNEPVQLALKDAIEKSVESLIIEGIQDKLWSTKDGPQKDKELVDSYLEEKAFEESKLLYDRTQTVSEAKNSISVAGISPLFNGDYAKKRFGFGASVGFGRTISENLSLQLEGAYLRFKTGQSFEKEFADITLNAQYNMLPYDDLAPFAYVGFGYLLDLDKRFNQIPRVSPAPKVQAGVGVIFKLSDTFDVKAFAESNFTFSDEIDLIESGKRDDYYYSFGVGVNYYFGRTRVTKTVVKQLETKQ